ncbi:PREDICTED: suppressor of cytokine signaling 6-like [Priapulus caudatus]|uniref:Suppressor of cytokine signaling 6-like n=1 Tax=Priapulus caudatus TaxID=37621 RepID=A0ABM1DS83_PRICU|nr:PREDICTED: suppressor of cytokine signaling 6-like [Priapulus caudatus]
MSFEEAEEKLQGLSDGSFLVRDSSNDHYILSLSFRTESRTRHCRIEYHKGRFGFGEIENSFGFVSVVNLIEHTVLESKKGKYTFYLRHPMFGRPPTRVQLTTPVSRFATMRSLQHMCRFVILRHVRHDHIDRLPLPQKIQNYLNDPHYYAE